MRQEEFVSARGEGQAQGKSEGRVCARACARGEEPAQEGDGRRALLSLCDEESLQVCAMDHVSAILHNRRGVREHAHSRGESPRQEECAQACARGEEPAQEGDGRHALSLRACDERGRAMDHASANLGKRRGVREHAHSRGESPRQEECAQACARGEECTRSHTSRGEDSRGELDEPVR
jgi:hypothetical protein